MSSNEPTSLARRFLGFCAAVFAGVVLLALALQILAQIWGWLAVLAVLGVLTFAGVRIARWRRERW